MLWEIDNNRCIGCTGCVGVCPFQALEWNERNGIIVDKEKCTLCGICEKFCPVNAIKVEK